MTKKSILEEALLEAQALEEAVKTNAKEILASTMKEEIEELVKESLTEQEIEFDAEEEEGVMGIDMDGEGDDDVSDIEIDLSDLPGLEQGGEDYDEEPLDLRNASDDEILKVFKLMGDSDGVIVTQDDNVIDIVDDQEGVEYKVELGESTLDDILESMIDDDDIAESDDTDTVFEIEIAETEDEYTETEDEYNETEDEYNEGEHHFGDNKHEYKRKDVDGVEMKAGVKGRHYKTYETEQVTDEAARTLGMGDEKRGGLPKFRGSKPSYVKESKRTPRISRRTEGIQKKYNKLVEHSKNQNALVEKLMVENKNMKSKVSEYKNALGDFRTKISEVAVFNKNLAYATKLFTEHSTSKEEKINIMRRFDSVESLNEGKTLYGTIKTELGKSLFKSTDPKTMTESIVKKITKSPSTGSTNLIENKVYESPQISRIKDMMSKLS
tara:strand:- start:88 stop:1404 length:1317 start_codon:yes stop_codon:yes gene_type:complete